MRIRSVTSGLCVACDQARHLYCDGAGFCECDLCVPYDLRGVGIRRAQTRLREIMGRPELGGAAIVAVLIAALAILLNYLLAGCAHAQLSGADFCQSPNPAKASAVVNCSGTGECLLVDALANQQIQVCSLVFDLGGTTPRAQLDYGTKVSTNCDTGATHLSGAMTASKTLDGPLDYTTAPAGKQLCLNLAGTSPTAVGIITYVQK